MEKLAIADPQPVSDMVMVTVVLAVYPPEAPLLPATLKLPHVVGVVVVVVAVVVLVVLVEVDVVADAPSDTVPGLKICDSRNIFEPPTVGIVWYCTTTLNRLRFCVPGMPGSSTQVTYW